MTKIWNCKIEISLLFRFLLRPEHTCYFNFISSMLLMLRGKIFKVQLDKITYLCRAQYVYLSSTYIFFTSSHWHTKSRTSKKQFAYARILEERLHWLKLKSFFILPRQREKLFLEKSQIKSGWRNAKVQHLDDFSENSERVDLKVEMWQCNKFKTIIPQSV